MQTSMTPGDPFREHPDLVRFGETAMATFDATVNATAMWSETDPHPDLAEIDTHARRIGIVGDWVVRHVKAGWPLDTVLAEAGRRARNINERHGGVQ